MKPQLALFEGKPVVPSPPSFSWPPITSEDEQRVLGLLRRGELSYYGREGEVEELEDKFRTLLSARYALASSGSMSSSFLSQ